MNEDTNNKLETGEVVNNTLTEGSNNISDNSVSSVSGNVLNNSPVNNDVVENVSNDKQISSGKFEEVSVSVDSDLFNTLNEKEVSENSVFNKKDDNVSNLDISGMKEGQEYLVEKQGFPYFMVIVFVLMILFAFYIGDIFDFVQKYIVKDEVVEENKDNEEEEEKKEEKEEVIVKSLSLKEIKESFENDIQVIDYEKNNNISIDVSISENKLIFTTINFLNVGSLSTLTVEFNYKDDILMAACDVNNSEFGKIITIFLIKEVAVLQGVSSVGLDDFIEKNLYTFTIDKGFELTNSEDGNNTYKILTKIKLNIE